MKMRQGVQLEVALELINHKVRKYYECIGT
jgi:hypothetical protein